MEAILSCNFIRVLVLVLGSFLVCSPRAFISWKFALSAHLRYICMMISSTSVDLLLVSEMSGLTMLSTRLWLGMLTMG